MKINRIVQRKASPATPRQAVGGRAIRSGVCLLAAALLMPFTSLWAQNLSVSGTVRDSKSDPVVGASVVVKGATVGVTTDANGGYTINASADATLVFSFLGLHTKEEAVDGRGRIDVTLSEDDKALEEVVVVGYGTVKKSNLTGAISSVTNEQLKERSSANAMSSLSGQVAGVQVQQTQGAPGYAPTIKIRGTSTINAGVSPLYVIDGIPIDDYRPTSITASVNLPINNTNPLSAINPQDIESIEILKDASSAAIYGSRGANGVVIITTKSGKEGRPKIDVGYERGLQQVARKVEMMDSQEFIRFWVDAHNNEYIKSGGSLSDPQSARPSNMQVPQAFLDNPEQFATTDWQDVLFQDANSDNFRISLTGGTAKASYMLSGNYLSQEGVVDRSKYQRVTVRSNVSYQVTDHLKTGANISFANINDRIYGTAGKSDVVSLAIQNDPIFPLYNEVGTLGFRDPSSEWSKFASYDLQQWHPYALTREADNYGRRLNVLATGFIEYSFLNHFSFKTSLSGTYNTNRLGYYRNEGENWGYSGWRVAEATIGTNQTDNWISENILSYNQLFGDHAVNAIAGYTAQKNHYESTEQTSQGFPNDLVHTLNAGSPTASTSEAQEWSLLSYIARVNYSFKDKYLLTATIRRDGSSRFGSDNKWGYFPSASLAWKVSEERWLQNVDWLSSLKLRASYGVTGNNQIPNYGAIALLSSQQYVWGTDVQIGLSPETISNPSLRWEKTGQFDFGLNAGLFNNRIYVEADYYHSRTTDLLLNVPVPAVTGFTQHLTNIGEVQNQGVEFLLTSRNLVSSFQWTTNINVSLNRNKIVSLGPKDSPISITEWDVISKYEVGQPVSNFYGYIFDGVFKNQAEIDAYPHNSTTTPGDPKVRDVDENGKIDENDRTIIGNPQPDFTYGMTNTFAFKNFDLSILLQGTYGNEIANQEARYSKRYNGGRNVYKATADYWRSEAEPGDGVNFKPYKTYPGLQTQSSTFFIEDGSYLRIANVRLGYTFPQKVLSALNLSTLRLYVNVDNVYVFSDYLGYDPENSTYSSALMSGMDFGGHPIPRTITFGINLGF
ncbi:MAG: TonB-dependent receptor [Prevotellaceae bacterium]|jgi:TonB-linked SusC/RagA family outer membrane protein|nr:TonB-dependent receptor [Prevotellaceae bacterium]